MNKRVFLRNALILTGSSLLLRAGNIGFRVYLNQQIGTAGMGLYQLILSVFTLAVTISTSGIGLAVTRIVTMAVPGENSVRSAVKKCVACSLLLSLLSGGILFLFSDPIAQYFLEDIRCSAPLRILSLGLPFMAVSSCMRGYFLAIRNASRPAIAELLEQFCTIGIVVSLFLIFAPQGLEQACCAVMIGSTAGEVISCGYHFIRYRLSVKKLPGTPVKSRGVLRQIIHIALPALTGYTMRTVLSAVENILIPRGLKKHGSNADSALSQYGMLLGMVMPILYFPSAFLGAFSSLLIPEMSEAHATGRKRGICHVTSRSMQMTLIFSFFVMVVFIAFSHEIGLAFYNSTYAGDMLRILAPLVPLMYLDSVVDGILKGLDQQFSSLKYNFSDSVLRVVLIWFSLPLFGMKGYLCVLFFSVIYNASLSIHRLLKVSEVHIDIKNWLIKPCACAAAAAAGSFSVCSLIPPVAQVPWLFCTGGIILCIPLYLALLWLTKGVTPEDAAWIRQILGGSKIETEC